MSLNLQVFGRVKQKKIDNMEEIENWDREEQGLKFLGG